MTAPARLRAPSQETLSARRRLTLRCARRPQPPPARRPADVARDRDAVGRRWVGMTWFLLVLNVLTFYPKTWSGQPLIVPIPSVIGKLITQGALPAALLIALAVNRRMLIRPSMYLGLISLLVVEALISAHAGQALRHDLPESSGSPVRRHPVAADAMVGPAGPAPGPVPPAGDGGRARAGDARA